MVEEHPVTSIIVNNFNYGRFLRNAIDSALEQTHPNVEVIVVDDGSTDESREVIASYGDRVTAVLKENGGQGSAFNAGFRVSRGEVVIFLDADDMLLPHAVETVIPLLGDRSVAKVHWLLYTFRDSELLKETFPKAGINGGDVLPAVLKHGPFAYASAPTSGNAFPRRWLERVMPLPEEEFRLGADSYLFTLAPVFGSIAVASEPLGLYRVSDNLVSQRTPARYFRDVYWNALEKALLHTLPRELGLTVAPEIWRSSNPQYARWTAIMQAEEELERSLPDNAPLGLVRTPRWKPPFALKHHTVDVIDFPDEATLAERLQTVQDLPSLGIKHVAIEGEAIGSTKETAPLVAALRHHYRCLFTNERITLFDLSASRPETLAKASIVIDNYNYARYLGAAIESALEQTYPETEVIVVDDGSTDDSREVIAQYDGQVTAVLKENGGQGSAFNAGFAASSGEVVFFLDADDMFLPQTVETVMSHCGDRSVALVQWYLYQQVDGELTGQVSSSFKLSTGDVLPTVLELGPFSYSPASTSGCAFPRWWLERVMPMPEQGMRINAETYLVNVAPFFGDIKTLPDILGIYRFGSDSMTHNTSTEQCLQVWRTLAEAMIATARSELGLDLDIDCWKRQNAQYVRWKAILDGECEVASVLPPGARVALLRRAGGWKPVFAPNGKSAEVHIVRGSDEITPHLDWIKALPQGSESYLAIEGAALKPSKAMRNLTSRMRSKYRCLLETDHVLLFQLSRETEEAHLSR